MAMFTERSIKVTIFYIYIIYIYFLKHFIYSDKASVHGRPVFSELPELDDIKRSHQYTRNLPFLYSESCMKYALPEGAHWHRRQQIGWFPSYARLGMLATPHTHHCIGTAPGIGSVSRVAWK